MLSVFSYHELGSTVSPFLLLDHIGPGKLLASRRPGGVNEHPHRGFETVTLVYAGELEHKDSSGGGGIIAAGDVQWMTAASGVIHSELFSTAFTHSGGAFEMVQLWVNLPAADKMNPPRYQNLSEARIPRIDLPESAGSVRVVAGTFGGHAGPAQTHTRMNVLDAGLNPGHNITFNTVEGDTALVYLLAGRLQLGADEILEDQSMAVMSSHGDSFALTALESSRFLVLCGEPINEPVNGHGPFVMNTYEEILQAYEDIKTGNFARPQGG